MNEAPGQARQAGSHCATARTTFTQRLTSREAQEGGSHQNTVRISHIPVTGSPDMCCIAGASGQCSDAGAVCPGISWIRVLILDPRKSLALA